MRVKPDRAANRAHLEAAPGKPGHAREWNKCWENAIASKAALHWVRDLGAILVVRAHAGLSRPTRQPLHQLFTSNISILSQLAFIPALMPYQRSVLNNACFCTLTSCMSLCGLLWLPPPKQPDCFLAETWHALKMHTSQNPVLGHDGFLSSPAPRPNFLISEVLQLVYTP